MSEKKSHRNYAAEIQWTNNRLSEIYRFLENSPSQSPTGIEDQNNKEISDEETYMPYVNFVRKVYKLDKELKYVNPTHQWHIERTEAHRRNRARFATILEDPLKLTELATSAEEAIQRLSPREQFVIRKYYGLNEEAQTFKNIGAQMKNQGLDHKGTIGISSQRAYEIHNRGLRKLLNRGNIYGFNYIYAT